MFHMPLKKKHILLLSGGILYKYKLIQSNVLFKTYFSLPIFYLYNLSIDKWC